MKPNENESYEDWIERARIYEYAIAAQHIAQGRDPTTVIEQMSRRLVQKMLHPVFQELRKKSETQFDSEQSRKQYQEQYLNKHAPVADHIDDDLFDNID